MPSVTKTAYQLSLLRKLSKQVCCRNISSFRLLLTGKTQWDINILCTKKTLFSEEILLFEWIIPYISHAKIIYPH